MDSRPDLSAPLFCALCSQHKFAFDSARRKKALLEFCFTCRHKFCAKCIHSMYISDEEHYQCALCAAQEVMTERTLEQRDKVYEDYVDTLVMDPILQPQQNGIHDLIDTPRSRARSVNATPGEPEAPITYRDLDRYLLIRSDIVTPKVGWAVNLDNILVQKGYIYVTDSSESCVYTFDRNGGYLEKLGGPGDEPGFFHSPTQIAGYNGKIVIGDAGNTRIQILEENGDYHFGFGWTEDKLIWPTGVAYHDNGLLVVDGHRVKKYNITNGELIAGPTTCSTAQWPNHICASEHGIFVSDFGGDSVYRLDSHLVFRERIGRGSEYSIGLKNPRGIALDQQGFLIIADWGNDRLVVLTPDLELDTTIEVKRPRDVAFDEHGLLLVVADHDTETTDDGGEPVQVIYQYQ